MKPSPGISETSSSSRNENSSEQIEEKIEYPEVRKDKSAQSMKELRIERREGGKIRCREMEELGELREIGCSNGEGGFSVFRET